MVVMLLWVCFVEGRLGESSHFDQQDVSRHGGRQIDRLP